MNKLGFAFALAIALSLRISAAVSVTAELSADETSIGMPVQLQVKVDGTTNVSLPGDLAVDGLQTRLNGRSTQVSIINGRMTTSGLYSYMVLPLREGTFEIPPIEVNANGQKLRTAALKLVVQPGTGSSSSRPVPTLPLPSGSAQGQQGSSSSSGEGGQLAYADFIVPRKSIYAGEVIPVEARFYFNERVGFQLREEQPQVDGEGFTVQKFSPAKQTEETIGQSRYHVLSFKTGLTAVKSGEMQLPKLSMDAVARIPSRGPRGMEDIFSQFFGNQGIPTDDQEIKVESKPAHIRVKALPVDGRPASFAGAVGEFTVSATADPVKAAAGDPVTLKVAVTGRGNFDAMGDPKLVDSDGWRVYPPTDKFEKSDTIGFVGTKTFELPIVAQQPQTHTPSAEFSYFDPIKEKYFTLKTQPVAVEAAAQAEPVASSAGGPAATPGAQPGVTPPPDANGAWLTRSTLRSWQPLVLRPVFWVGNGAVAVLLVALVVGSAMRRSRLGPRGQRAATMRQRDELIAQLGSANLSDSTFFAKAQEVLALQAGLAGESGPFEFVASLEARGRDTSDMRTVLAQANEIKFSGGRVSMQVDAAERRRIASALKEACQ